MITADKQRAEHRPMTLEAYHADLTHDSNSSLRLFERSRAAYYGQRIKQNIPRPDGSSAQRLGTNAHAAILQTEHFYEHLSIVPPEVLGANGAKNTKAYKEWVAERTGKYILTQAEADEIEQLVHAIDANAACRDLLRRATTFEHPVFYSTEDGHLLKACFDFAAELEAIVGDVKTSRHGPKEFWKSVRDHGYACQADIYCRAYEAMYGIRPQFKFLVVYKCDGAFEPYVRTLPADWIELGRRQNNETLATLAACKRGELPWVNEGHDVDVELERPEWMLAADPYEGY
jgi:hypothetical protein